MSGLDSLRRRDECMPSQTTVRCAVAVRTSPSCVLYWTPATTCPSSHSPPCPACKITILDTASCGKHRSTTCCPDFYSIAGINKAFNQCIFPESFQVGRQHLGHHMTALQNEQDPPRLYCIGKAVTDCDNPCSNSQRAVIGYELFQWLYCTHAQVQKNVA